MNIKAELLKPQSTSQRVKTGEYILHNTHLFDELMIIFLGQDYRLQQRSAWLISHVTPQKASLLEPYYQQIIPKLKQSDIPDTFKRNVVRVWQDISLPEQYLGEIYDICCGFLNGKEAIAIKVFSMTVCYNISNRFPELKNELLAVIEDVVRKDGQRSKGILSRGNKTLNLLKGELQVV